MASAPDKLVRIWPARRWLTVVSAGLLATDASGTSSPVASANAGFALTPAAVKNMTPGMQGLLVYAKFNRDLLASDKFVQLFSLFGANGEASCDRALVYHTSSTPLARRCMRGRP